jgi:hypothetical protein
MLEKIKKFFGIENSEHQIDTYIELEKSINDNKNKALLFCQDYLPEINKLQKNFNLMSIYNELTKSESKKLESFFMVDKIKSKLDLLKSEYYIEIGKLKKENDLSETKLNKLRENKELVSIVEYQKKFDSLNKSLSIVTESFLSDKISKEMFAKAVSTYKKELGVDTLEKAIKPGKVKIVMDEFKNGDLKTEADKKVTNPKQAIAIALNEAGMSKSENIQKFKEWCKNNKKEPDEKNIIEYIKKYDLNNEIKDILISNLNKSLNSELNTENKLQNKFEQWL